MTTTCSVVRRGSRRASVVALAVLGLLSLAACGGSRPPAGTSGGRATSLSGPALATSLGGSDGSSWAVVDMGSTASALNSFWELFVRPAGSSTWRLATPTGVASNGGLVMTQSTPGEIVTGFRPSQDLTFSPLASSGDAGARWSADAPLNPGLADVPGALAGNSAGHLIALTQSGDVESAAAVGAAWTRLTSLGALAKGPAGRACGLTALTAVAWTPAGAPLVAGDCSKPGVTGIFTLSAGGWHAAAPRLTGSPARSGADVVGLTTTAGRTTAVLTVGNHATASVITAWSLDGGTHWTQSAPLPSPALASGGQPSVSFSADGSAGLVVTPAARQPGASQVATIGWLGSDWDVLPALNAAPARSASSRVATLVAAPGGAPQALEVDGGTMTVWQLGTGNWTIAQTIRVPIPYGSSG
ncbi:MAG TPA: hypothetical protein VEV45_03605 [Streptosporangiaceae bacterium]|nr:hypothetical protein [Streptosporangiaceae bacterium]